MRQFFVQCDIPDQGVLGSIVSSITGILRSVLPVGDMSDAGIGLLLNVIFFAVALLFHIINKMLSDGGDHIGANQRVFHNLVTKNKQLEAALQQYVLIDLTQT